MKTSITTSLLRKLKGPAEVRTPIGTEIYLPNKSGKNDNTNTCFSFGSVAAPSITFCQEKNTGIYHLTTSNTMAFSVTGIKSFSCDINGIRLIDGTEGSPSLSFDSSASTGLFTPATHTLCIATNNTEKFRVDETKVLIELPLYAQNGSSSAPSVTFEADTNTGFFKPGLDQMDATCNATQSFRFSEQGGGLFNGTAGSPSLYFVNDTNTGFWRDTADQINISIGGTEKVNLTESGFDLLGGYALSLYGATSGYVSQGTPATVTSYSVKWPSAQASGAQYLKNDGSGNLSWATPAGGSDAFPVGSVFISVVSTNPATLLGYGTWSAIAAGRMLVGLDSGDADFDTVEETGGAKSKVLVQANLPNISTGAGTSHTHTLGNVLRVSTTGTDTTLVALTQDTTSTKNSVTTTDAEAAHTHSLGGSGTAVNTLSPYFVVYMWKRTA